MTNDERIARLQALLARIVARRRPGASPNGVHVPSLMMTAPGLGARRVSPLPPPPPPPRPSAPSPLPPPPSTPPPSSSPGYANGKPDSGPRPTATPPRPTAPPTFAPADTSLDLMLTEAATAPPPRRAPPPEVSEVRRMDPPPMEVVELDIDPDPSIPPPPFSEDDAPPSYPPRPSYAPPPASYPPPSTNEGALESRSRLVTAPPASLDSVGNLDEDRSIPPSDPTIEVGAVEMQTSEIEALGDERDEGDEGDGGDEMGATVGPPPSLPDEDDDRPPASSRRPVTMEGKMSEADDEASLPHAPPPESGKLLAASPAIDLAFDPETTGVHRHEALMGIAAPEAVRATPLPGAQVATFVAQTKGELAATTFGELLEATLSF